MRYCTVKTNKQSWLRFQIWELCPLSWRGWWQWIAHLSRWRMLARRFTNSIWCPIAVAVRSFEKFTGLSYSGVGMRCVKERRRFYLPNCRNPYSQGIFANASNPEMTADSWKQDLSCGLVLWKMHTTNGRFSDISKWSVVVSVKLPLLKVSEHTRNGSIFGQSFLLVVGTLWPQRLDFRKRIPEILIKMSLNLRPLNSVVVLVGCLRVPRCWEAVGVNGNYLLLLTNWCFILFQANHLRLH